MAFFIVPRRFARTVPSETARFLRDHELLYRATHVMSHRHRVNLVNEAQVPTWNSGSLELVTSDCGVSPRWNDGSRYYNIPAGACDTTTPWTYAFVVGFSSLVNENALISQSDTALTAPMDRSIWYATGSGLRSSIYETTYRNFTSAIPGTYTTRAYVATMTTGEWNWYFDGRRFGGTNSYSATGTTLASSSVLNIARGYNGVTTFGITGWMPLFIRVYGKAWSPGEAMEFCRDPWQMFEQTPEVLYFIPAATGGSFNAAWACGSNAVIQPGAMQ